MIHCGLSTPQTVTLSGANFPAVAKVLVTAPDSDRAVEVTPDSVSSTLVVFAFVFAVCGDYTIVIADATGQCDGCASEPFTLSPTPLPCPTLETVVTLGDLRRDTQHRLGDDAGAIWPDDEVAGNLVEAYILLATQLPIFWDVEYSENLPRGFSYTQPWERAFLRNSGAFDYGCANFTAEFERTMGRAIGFRERDRIGPANHTSPFELRDGHLEATGASLAIPATVELSKRLTKLDRATWDNRAIDAVEPRSWQNLDGRYETNRGDVHAYTWQKDGVRTFRKILVPAAQGDVVSVSGSWGIPRTTSDLTATAPTGTWGVPRIIEGHHPIGPESWGTPRRFYLEGKNVRVEHFRQGRVMDADAIVCELPYRYTRYLMDYAMASCLSRPGPGCDQALADHFDKRWQRGVQRIERRLRLVDTERVVVLGGGGQPTTGRPPRPKLPANYGSRVR